MTAMIKDQIDILVKLQNVESKKSFLSNKLSEVPKKLSDIENRLTEFEKTVKEESDNLDDLKKRYRSYESDLQTREASIKKSREKLHYAKNNKEYQMSLKEIEELREKTSRIEDDILESLDTIEKLEESITIKKREFDDLKSSVEKEKEKILEEEGVFSKQLEELDEQSRAIQEQMDSYLLNRFNNLKEKGMGVAIAPVKKAVCQGCHMNIPPQMYNELQRYDSMKQCPYCQRIIYWEPAE